MAINFRKSKGFGPFRVTLTKSGISSSFGLKGFRFTSGPRGVHSTIGIPGTGIYSRTKISDTKKHIGPSWNRWDSKFGTFAKIFCTIVYVPIIIVLVLAAILFVLAVIGVIFFSIFPEYAPL